MCMARRVIDYAVSSLRRRFPEFTEHQVSAFRNELLAAERARLVDPARMLEEELAGLWSAIQGAYELLIRRWPTGTDGERPQGNMPWQNGASKFLSTASRSG